MRIFISYASENRDVAEAITHSIQARGHDVFFDKHNLPAGDSYEEKIERGIDRSDVFVFLISPHSVTPGSFALSELGMAQKRWKHPAGRVLPVMIEQTSYDIIPAYAKAVTVLEPKGNVSVEVAASIHSMRRFSWRPIAIAGVVLVAGVLGAYLYFSQPNPQISVAANGPIPFERSYFGKPDVYNLVYNINNTGNLAGRIVSSRLETDPPDQLSIISRGPEYSAETPVLVPRGGKEINHFLVTLSGSALASFQWDICSTSDVGTETCTEKQPWKPKGDFSPATAFQLPAEISRNATHLATLDGGFLVTSRNPGAIHLVGPDGTVRMKSEFAGEPTALYADAEGIFVGARGPDALLRLDPADLHILAQTPVNFPRTIRDAFDDPVSDTPASIGRSAGRIWITTSGGASGAGLMHFAEDLSDPRVPDYYSDISTDLDGLHLSSNGAQVWGTSTNVTPASLYRFEPDVLKKFGGHDWDIASCATDVLVRDNMLLVPDCDGVVQRVTAEPEKLQIIGREDSFFGDDASASIWTETYLRQTDTDNILVFTVNKVRGSDMEPSRSIVTRLNPSHGSKLALEIGEASIVDLAAQEGAFMAIVENGTGQRETVALKNE